MNGVCRWELEFSCWNDFLLGLGAGNEPPVEENVPSRRFPYALAVYAVAALTQHSPAEPSTCAWPQVAAMTLPHAVGLEPSSHPSGCSPYLQSKLTRSRRKLPRGEKSVGEL